MTIWNKDDVCFARVDLPASEGERPVARGTRGTIRAANDETALVDFIGRGDEAAVLVPLVHIVPEVAGMRVAADTPLDMLTAVLEDLTRRGGEASRRVRMAKTRFDAQHYRVIASLLADLRDVWSTAIIVPKRLPEHLADGGTDDDGRTSSLSRVTKLVPGRPGPRGGA